MTMVMMMVAVVRLVEEVLEIFSGLAFCLRHEQDNEDGTDGADDREKEVRARGLNLLLQQRHVLRDDKRTEPIEAECQR